MCCAALVMATNCFFIIESAHVQPASLSPNVTRMSHLRNQEYLRFFPP